MPSTREVVAYLDGLLDPQKVKDCSCNGLQVQGADEVRKVGLAVDASLTAYRRAVDAGCQMLVVHHGLIWNGLRSVSGTEYRHLKFLLDNGLNLYASHLPLDMHPEVGNNALLAKLLGLSDVKPFGEYHGLLIGCKGRLPQAMKTEEIAARLRDSLHGETFVLPFGAETNRTVGVVSGFGADELGQAIAEGLDCFVTGESAHQNHHQALDGNINAVYCGHYHSEQVGVREVGKVLAREFGLDTEFLDVPTLV